MISNGGKRFHDLDALRGYAMLLGIVLHGLMSFIAISFWPAQDRYQNTEVCGAILSFIHGFRLPLFFLISGFFTAMLWRKRGMKGLFKQRAIRILIPLAVGTMVTWALVFPISIWGNSKKSKVTRVEQSEPQGKPLFRLVKQGSVEEVEERIAAGSDLERGDPAFELTPLAWAVIEGRPEIVSVLIEAGADLNPRDGEGSTPLHAASFLGRGTEASLLIEAGADVNARNHNGETPLDSQRHGMPVVNWVTDMLGVTVKRVELYTGREEVKAALVSAGGENGVLSGSMRQILDLWRFGAQVPVFQHLWFLYYLCWLVVLFFVAVVSRKLIPWRIPAWAASTPWCWLWILPATLLFQLFMREGVGADTSPGILPWPPKLLYYAVFFGFGAVSYGNVSFETRAGRRRPGRGEERKTGLIGAAIMLAQNI